jgi:hypothetical protein
MASKVRSVYASLASSNDQRRHRVISDHSRIEWSKYPLVICQGTLKNENRTSSQEISSSCACRHVIWIHSRSHGLNAISGEDYASHANHAIKGDVGSPGSGSKSTATKFRGVLTGLLGLDLLVAVVRVPDTKVLRNSDILHLEIVSQGFKFIARNSVLHAAYGSSAPAVGAAWAGAWACECWPCG